jgi:hypothetical protein
VLNDFGEVKFKNAVLCSANGALIQPKYALMDGAPNIKVETLSHSGEASPPPSKWIPGYAWSYQYRVRISMTANGQTLPSEGTVTVKTTIVGTEKVKVAAGAFDTLKLQSVSTSDLKMTMQGRTFPNKTSISTTIWVSKGVGMVKSVATQMQLQATGVNQTKNLATTTELIRFTK